MASEINVNYYAYTEEHGYVATDGWTEELDPPRNSEELAIISGPRCPECGKREFDLMLGPSYEWCGCERAYRRHVESLNETLRERLTQASDVA